VTISYRNTFSDVMALCVYHCLHLPLLIGVFACVIAFLSYVYWTLLPREIELVPKLLVVAAVDLIFASVFVALSPLLIALTYISRKNKTILTDRTVTLFEDSFVEESSYSRTEAKWLSLQKLVRTRKHIFLYVSQHAAHAIPRRAFKTQEEWDDFYEFCRRKKLEVS
jgi:hypothetical protein